MKSSLFCLTACTILFFTGCSRKDETFTASFEGPYAEKTWAISDLNPELPSDWSAYDYLTFDLRSSTPQRFTLRIHDAQGIRSLSINPFQNAWVRASIPLIHFRERNVQGHDMAAISKTPRPGYWINFSRSVGSLTNIDSLGLSVRLPIGSPVIEIRDVRLTMSPEDTIIGPLPLIDEFGQWIPADWEGKAGSLEELKKAWAGEEKDLQPGNFNLSRYGGFLNTRVEATGFFRVEMVGGKWWFVDPDGHLFFSNGSCVMRLEEFHRVEGREYIFTELPPAEFSAAGQSSGRNTVSFYAWNQFRRFGREWHDKWVDLTIRRMDSWGLNTIANWSDAALMDSQRKAYVVSIGGLGINTGVMGLPDVYADGFAEMVDAAIARQCAPRRDDPFLLGYFIGNEPPWPHRVQDFINLVLAGEETPMKAELNKYLAGGDTPERRENFAFETFTRFLEIVDAALKKYDPNHLNLGIRFGETPPEAFFRASKGYFDVFSTTIYGYSIGQIVDDIYRLSGLPVIIGEFHFGTPGRGLAPGLAQTVNEEERGVAYRYYMENAAAHPAVAGVHWFQWIDQASTGRFDGENYNIGFIDVTDRPYMDLVNAAKQTHQRLYDIHSGNEDPVRRQSLVQ